MRIDNKAENKNENENNNLKVPQQVIEPAQNSQNAATDEFKKYIFDHMCLFDAIPYVVFFKDLNNTVIGGNKQYNEIISAVNNRENNKLINDYKESALTKENQIFTFEVYVKTTKGNKCFEICKSLFFDKLHNLKGIIVIAKDITKEKILDEKKETFIATLVHDLKSPTLAQIQALKLLLNKTYGNLSENQFELIKEIEKSCEYTYSIIDSLLTNYKYENKKIKLQQNEINLLNIATECKNSLENTAKEKKLTINVKNNISNYRVYADKLEIKRVIMNLLTNAISYSKPNSNINITITKTKQKIQFEVTNQGEYIPKEALIELFEKYVSKEQKLSKINTGLGLYITKQIIHAHNGKLIMKSTKDGKNSFGFELNI